uniref:Uncharacterized protein n=1 Tax=Phlebotomus papatasi TaxID=29031 RepID=A0A1B0DND5_PHLPP
MVIVNTEFNSPVCSASNVGIVGASLEESVTIPCRVSADPAIVDFEWTFSSSGERFEVPPGHYVTMQDTQSIGHGDSSHTEMDVQNSIETVSELVYTPKNERDYGTLACWGKNSIGKQADPCIFQVVPADFRNCTRGSLLTVDVTPELLTSSSVAFDGFPSAAALLASAYLFDILLSSALEPPIKLNLALSRTTLLPLSVPSFLRELVIFF